jgi:phenylalanyl-tRNA synthetase beta chain
VSVPGHRRYDVSRPEDLIEDMARRHGYDAFSAELRPFRPSTVPTHPLFLREDRLRTLLVRRGFLEARTAAFAPETDGDVALQLPLAATESRLRRALLPGLLRRVEYNFARGAKSIRLFELGTVFAAGEPGGLPRESVHLAVACTGQRRPPHFTEPAAAFDVWDLKAIAEEIAHELALSVAENADDPLLEPALSFRLAAGDNAAVRGAGGRVRAHRVDAPAWADDVWALEVDLVAEAAGEAAGAEAAASATLQGAEVRYRELPQFPAIERDFALLVPDAVAAGTVGAAIRAEGGPLLEAAEPFDLYSGTGVAAGSRSIAFRLRFRALDRTLADAEIDPLVKRILQRLETEHGIRQRA